MRTWLKWILRILGVLLLLAVILLAYNWKNVKRLVKVNTLFNEDRIVANFSGMRDLFFFKDMTGNTAGWNSFPENKQELPATYSFNGEEGSITEWKDERSLTALVVLKDGEIVHEEYLEGTGQDDRRISWSMSKSFISALTGILQAQGKIPSLDIKVTDTVPELKGTAYEGVTLRNLLNMSSGVAFNEDYLDYDSDINRMGRVLALGGSMDEFAASLKERKYEPGTYNKYVSIDTHVIGMVLRALTGRPIPEMMSEYIMEPMALKVDPYYLTDGHGVAFVLGGLNLTTRDYARFGQMYANGGRLNGKQIVPEEWVKESVRNSAPPPDPEIANLDHGKIGYGYQWWVPPIAEVGEYFASGIYGQHIYINTRKNVVIAMNSADRNFREGDGRVKLQNVAVFRAIMDGLE